MIPEAKYELVSSQEASNGFGIKILVCSPPDQALRETDKEEIRHVACKLYEDMQGRLHRNHPDEIEATKKEREDILALFGDRTIFVEEIPNGYSTQYGRPWFVVTTRVGRIKIGWRKRVINIDWSETVGKVKAEELFKDETTTKGDSYDNYFYIHAWSYEKAKEYLDKILGANLPSFASFVKSLSVRTRKDFDRDGITSFEQLLGKTEDDLLEMKNFGMTGLREVQDRLAKLGLKLKE